MGTTTFTWTSTSSGDWNTASNWSPATVPNSGTADVEINKAGSYTITIAGGASDTIDLLDMQQGAGALEVDGTLAFAAGSAGSITGPLQTTINMNGGTILNAGTINPHFGVSAGATAVFAGTNAVYFANELDANAGATALVNTTKGLAEVTGNTLFDGVFGANNGTIDLGGNAGATLNLQTIEGPPLNPAGFTALYLIGSLSAINEFNGTSYASVESSVTTLQSAGTIFALNRNYANTHALTINNGGEFFESSGTLTAAGSIAVGNGGTLLGSSADIASPVVDNGIIE